MPPPPPFLLLFYISFLLSGRAFAIHSDEIFEPPFLSDSYVPVNSCRPDPQNACYPNRDSDEFARSFNSGYLSTAILAGRDEMRALATSANNSDYELIYTAGYADNGVDLSIALAVFNNDGTVNTSFHTDGKSALDLTNKDDMIHAAYITGAPKHIFAGRTGGGDVKWLIGRISTLGTLDTSFYTAGYRTGAYLGEDEILRGIVVHTNATAGEFFTAGYGWSYGRFQFVVARYDSDGSLDPNFNTVGWRMTDISGSDSGALALSVATGGMAISKPLLAGPAMTGGVWDFAFARYNTVGTLDTSFNTDGKAIFGVLASNDRNYAVYIETAGNLIYSGGYASTGVHNDFAVVRLTSTGALDTGFSTDGKVTSDFGGADDVIFAFAPKTYDKKIYAAGSSNNAGNINIATARYHTDGTLDTAFHTDGKATFDVGGGNDFGTSIKQSAYSASLWVGGKATNATVDFVLFRVHTDGSLARAGQVSNSFGTNGILVTDVAGGNDASFGLWSDTTAKSSIFGGVGKSGNDAAIFRYNLQTGGLDGSFGGGDGIMTFDNGGTEVLYAAYARDSSTAVNFYVGGNGSDFFVMSHKGDAGTLDTTFSTDGYHTVDFSGTDVAYGVILSGGNHTVAGTDGAATSNFAVARFTTGGLDTSFHTDGKETYSPTGNAAQAYGVDTFVKAASAPVLVAGHDTADMAAILLSTDGSLATSFNTDGKMAIDCGATDTLAGIVMDTGAAVYLLGGNGSDFCIARVLSTGTLDTAYHTDGIVLTDFGGGSEVARSGHIDRQLGKKAYIVGGNGVDMLFSVYLSNGTLDTSFNTSGKQTVNGAGNDEAYGIILTPSGELCAVGSANSGADALAACLTR